MTAAALHAAAAELVSHAVDVQLGHRQATARLAATVAGTPADLLPVLRDALGAALMAVLDKRAEHYVVALPAGVEGHLVGGRHG